MKRLSSFAGFTVNKIMALAALAAFALAAIGANQLCIYWYHQPEMPEQVRMLKKH